MPGLRGWHDVPALAEVVTRAAYSSLGERGLLLLQIGAAMLGWSMLVRGRRQGSAEGSAALVCLLVLVGSLPQLVVTRYLFSLALFPLLGYLLEEESRLPSRRIWLAVPLLALCKTRVRASTSVSGLRSAHTVSGAR
jgi:hypothetical protein